MPRILLVLLLFPLLLASGAHAQDVWSIHLPGGRVATSPVRTVGDVGLVDALSFADALGVDYHRDDDGRYVFSFPGSRAVFAPDAPFAELNGVPVQLPVAPRVDNHRLFVPETAWLAHVNAHAPGEVMLHRAPRALTFTPIAADLIGIRVITRGDTIIASLQLSMPQPGEFVLTDSQHVDLRLPETTPPDISLSSLMTRDTLPGEVSGITAASWDGARGVLRFTTRRPVRHARLEGPSDDARLTLTLVCSDPGDDLPASDPANLDDDRRRWTIDTVVIDPGHGGKDPGAIGKSGTREKEMALSTGLLVRDLLKKRLPSVKVIMTRDDDTFIPLAERTRIANRVGGKLFVSIHFNSAGDRRAHGLETYFLAPARTERAMKIAMKENSVVRYEEQIDQYPELGDEAFILLSMAQAQFSKESEDLAAMVLDGMSGRTGQKSRGVDQAGFYVLMGASMPAILVEGGFLSNAKEEKLVRTKAYRQKVAESVVDAIETFITKYENES